MMRLRVRVIVLAALLVAASGCSDPYAVDPATRFDQLFDEMCEGMADLKTQMAVVHDEESLEATLPKIRSTVDKIVAVIHRQNDEFFSKGFQPGEEQEREVKRKFALVTNDLKQEGIRMRDIPGGYRIAAEVLRIVEAAKSRPKTTKPTVSRQRDNSPDKPVSGSQKPSPAG